MSSKLTMQLFIIAVGVAMLLAWPLPLQAQEANQSAESKLEELQRELEALKKQLQTERKPAKSTVRFSGDLRLRHESIFNENFSRGKSRHRERVRLRFGFTADVTERLEVGARLVTGDLLDPTSTNQTFSGNFSRLPIAWDRIYLSYRPADFLKVSAGKFENPLFTPTEILWDSDLQPEGLAEAFTFQDLGAVKRLTLTGGQFVLREFNGTLSLNPRSWIFAGQLTGELGVHPDFSLTLASSYFAVTDADQIAVAQNQATPTLTGGNTNRKRRDAAGNVIGFASGYRMVNVSARAVYQMTYPLTLNADYVHNFGAVSENDAWMVTLTLGQTKKAGDWSIGYGYASIAADAVLSAFNSDDLQSTNVAAHVVQLAYQVFDPVTINLEAYIQRQLNFSLGRNDDVTKPRIRANVLVKF